MGSRKRKQEETYEEYRDALRSEAQVQRTQLKGKWAWKTYFPIDKNTTNLPKGAKTYYNAEGQQFVKLPPFVKPKEET